MEGDKVVMGDPPSPPTRENPGGFDSLGILLNTTLEEINNLLLYEYSTRTECA